MFYMRREGARNFFTQMLRTLHALYAAIRATPHPLEAGAICVVQ